MKTITVRGWEYQVNYKCDGKECFVTEVYPLGSEVDINDLITSNDIRRDFDNALQSALNESDFTENYKDKNAIVEENINEGLYDEI